MVTSLPKGVFDILPNAFGGENLWKSSRIWRYVESVARGLCDLYGFREVRTPVFEKTEVFHRVGEHTDIVRKETYTFLDRKGRSLTLRPEGTAAVARALVEHRLYEGGKENKLFYLAPMFRYERQQAGRYRQHHQFGVEAIGVRHPFKDAEVVSLLWDFFSSLGLKKVCLRVNYLTAGVVREAYFRELKDFFSQRYDQLSPISRERFSTNPMRILDSKEPEDRALLKDVPSGIEFLKEEDRRYLEIVCSALEGKGIECILDPLLVRGLDYYTGFVFEAFIDGIGGQNSIGGGGRYDNLIAESGGPDIPAFGFGIGLERVIRTLVQQQVALPGEGVVCRFLPIGEEAEKFCFLWADALRRECIPAEVDYSRKSVKNMLKSASVEQIPFVCVVGDDELRHGTFVLRSMRDRKEESGSQKDIKEKLLYEVQNAQL
ncbi:histidine--tRNA ligase [Chlamydiifrater phoenicopteri]|uniref:histidine--tRNA ligase n=1 Tax=Chlamydiifrater phoenicopteri TaxID=2681469 RepID=UPI001BCFB99C|nr:histidine--tRNA ligase [Chlamydiifrater phoenicopteri]